MTAPDLADPAAPSGALDPPRQCTALTQAGARCRQVGTVNDTGLCVFHDPARAEELMRLQTKGGVNSRPRVVPDDLPGRPETLSDVCSYLGWLVDATARGELDKDTSSKLTYALTSMRGALTQRDLERQVESLRTELRTLRSALGPQSS